MGKYIKTFEIYINESLDFDDDDEEEEEDDDFYYQVESGDCYFEHDFTFTMDYTPNVTGYIKIGEYEFINLPFTQIEDQYGDIGLLWVIKKRGQMPDVNSVKSGDEILMWQDCISVTAYYYGGEEQQNPSNINQEFEEVMEDDEEEEEEDEIFSSNDDLNAFAYELKNAGFTLIVPEKPSTWFFFTQYNKIGQVSIDRGEFRFTSVHKPSRQWGTGFGLESTYEPTVQLAVRTMNTTKPGWDRQQGFPDKFKSVEEFLAKSILNYRVV